MKKRGTMRQSGGFTLIELVVAVILSTIILAGMGMVISSAFNSYDFNTTQGERTQMVRSTLERLTREIRNSTNVAQATLESPIIISKTTSAGTTTITYTLSNNQLVYFNGTTTVVLWGPEYGITVNAMRLDYVPGLIDESKTRLAKVTFTLAIDGDPVSVTASGAPRINHLYVPNL